MFSRSLISTCRTSASYGISVTSGTSPAMQKTPYNLHSTVRQRGQQHRVRKSADDHAATRMASYPRAASAVRFAGGDRKDAGHERGNVVPSHRAGNPRRAAGRLGETKRLFRRGLDTTASRRIITLGTEERLMMIGHRGPFCVSAAADACAGGRRVGREGIEQKCVQMHTLALVNGSRMFVL